MLATVKQFFSAQLSLEDKTDQHCQLQLAAAALLIETSRADYQRDSKEQQAIESALGQCFDLNEQQLEELTQLAEEQNQQATSLHPFTRLIKDNYSMPQRFELVTMLWQVAFADGEISKYEDHLIRKIAELIYLPHSDFIKAKLAAKAKS